MACSSTCPTQDHASWGECVRAKNVGSMQLGGVRPSHDAYVKWDKQTDELRQVVQAGGTIATAQNKGYDAAYKEAADKKKRAHDVATGSD